MRQAQIGSGAVAWVIAVAITAGTAFAEDPKPFPDEWFFYGTQRPAPLKELEGKPAAEIEIETWIGDKVSIAENRGKVIVVDFWATWCGPCMASIPHNVELVKQYHDRGLVFVGVHDSNNGWDSASKTVQSKGINYPVGKDKAGGASVKSYAVQFWPTYVVIDRNGIIRAAGLTPDRVEDVIKVLLEELGSSEPPAVAEFEPDSYYGKDNRPRAFRSAEGKAAPKIAGQEWIGSEIPDGAWQQTVSVVTFVSPSLGVSLAELEKLVPVQKEFAPQGVLFLAMCDGRAAWEKMKLFAAAKSLPLPVLKDTVGAPAEGDVNTAGASVTAAAFGVPHYPATYVIDRAGKVRAAGVRADKLKPILEKLLAETLAEAPDQP